MTVFQKVFNCLPNLEDFKRILPFLTIATLAGGIVFYHQKNQIIAFFKTYVPGFLEKDEILNDLAKLKEDVQDYILKQLNNEGKEVKEEEEEEEKKNLSGKMLQPFVPSFKNRAEKGGDNQVPSITTKLQKKTSQHQISNKRGVKKLQDSISNDESGEESLEFYKSHENGLDGYNSFVSHDMFNFNFHKHHQGQDNESEIISELSAIPQQLKNQPSKEKRQKKVPIKIFRNFATDTENNEKLQKLKKIALKQHKIEDKVYFHLLLNIVGTEVDEVDDN